MTPVGRFRYYLLAKAFGGWKQHVASLKPPSKDDKVRNRTIREREAAEAPSIQGTILRCPILRWWDMFMLGKGGGCWTPLPPTSALESYLSVVSTGVQNCGTAPHSTPIGQ